MRRQLLLLALLALLAGCTAPSPPAPGGAPAEAAGDDGRIAEWRNGTARGPHGLPPGTRIETGPVPVVEIDRRFNATTAEGGPWRPRWSPVHGCDPNFRIDAGARAVNASFLEEDAADATAVVQLPPREIDGWNRAGPALWLPRLAATEHRLPLGNAGDASVVVRIEGSDLWFGGHRLQPGDEGDFTYVYAWERDGERAFIEETFHVRHLGLWDSPLRVVAPTLCL